MCVCVSVCICVVGKKYEKNKLESLIGRLSFKEQGLLRFLSPVQRNHSFLISPETSAKASEKMTEALKPNAQTKLFKPQFHSFCSFHQLLLLLMLCSGVAQGLVELIMAEISPRL